MNRNNILALLSLVIMLCFCGFAYYLFSKVEEEKNKNEALTAKLTISENRVKELLDSNKTLLSQSVETNRQLSEYIVNSNSNIQPSETLKKLFQQSNEVASEALKLNDLPKYQQAAILEQEGFIALTNNKFNEALVKFSQAEKVSPSFHMTYEISRLLKKEKENLDKPETQKEIKQKIVNQYNWKAPKEQITVLKKQVNQ